MVAGLRGVASMQEAGVPARNGQWEKVLGTLKAELGEAVFKSWLKPLALARAEGSEVVIAAPTRFMRDWVERHYLERMKALWTNLDPTVRVLEVRVVRTPAPKLAPARPANTADGVAPTVQSAEATEERIDFGAALDPRFTFDNFVVGKSNEFAYAAARRVAEATVVPFNPMFLYGGVGLGKTHLMHAIAWHIREKHPTRKVLYLSAEKFMYQFIRALRFRDTMAFKEQFRNVDVLMIDDVQFISGRDSTQEEFFHTFNALVDQNRQIVISADKSPSDLEGMEERMRSRLGWGLVADIHQTDYELRLGILESKSEQLGAAIPPKVLEFLAHKITANVRELEGAMNRIL